MSVPGGHPASLAVAREESPGREWDELVRHAPGATFCHLAAWHGIVSDVLGHEPEYLTARTPAGEVAGVLPLVALRSRLFGRYLVSMPFLNYGGPVGSPEARERLARAAVDRGRACDADLVELRCRAGTTVDAPGGRGLRSSERKVTVVLLLPEDPEVLWRDRLRSKVRNQVRRPLKEGLEVRFGPDEMAPFYDVFSRHMRELGTPVLPRRLFEALGPAFGSAVLFGCVYRGDTPVAAACGFRFDGEFEVTWASALREHGRAAPNMLLYWRLMERAIRDGAAVFNFGRCSPGAGTHRFKRQWGGEDEPLPWRAWSANGRRTTPSPDEGKYRIATEVWRRLPLGLTRTLGPPLARLIP